MSNTFLQGKAKMLVGGLRPPPGYGPVSDPKLLVQSRGRRSPTTPMFRHKG